MLAPIIFRDYHPIITDSKQSPITIIISEALARLNKKNEIAEDQNSQLFEPLGEFREFLKPSSSFLKMFEPA